MSDKPIEVHLICSVSISDETLNALARVFKAAYDQLAESIDQKIKKTTYTCCKCQIKLYWDELKKCPRCGVAQPETP